MLQLNKYELKKQTPALECIPRVFLHRETNQLDIDDSANLLLTHNPKQFCAASAGVYRSAAPGGARTEDRAQVMV